MDEVLVGVNDWFLYYFYDLYCVNVVFGECSRLLFNEGFFGFFIDDDFEVCLVVVVMG